jgi:hypothetical protein
VTRRDGSLTAILAARGEMGSRVPDELESRVPMSEALDVENRRSWVLEKLRGPDVGAPERSVCVVGQLCSLYAAHGLFDGDRALPLDCDCPAAAACWSGLGALERPPRAEAPISVPWIGPGYAAGGVVAVAINFNSYGGLGGQWWIRRGAIDALRAGHRKRFDYRTGTYLALIHACLAGQQLDAEPATATVADAWEASAFVEAIKCSPRRTSSRPTEAMWRNCPPRYLVDELELLAPGAILLVGQDTMGAVAGLLSAELVEDQPRVWRGRSELSGRPVELVGCNHPSFGHWRTSTPSLARSLGSHPLEPLR